MKFACTACGKCCRVGAHSVVLDPHDVFRMSRSPALEIYAQQAQDMELMEKNHSVSKTKNKNKRCDHPDHHHHHHHSKSTENEELIETIDEDLDEESTLVLPERRTTTQLFALFPEAFNFELTRYPVKDDDDVVAPFCSLKPRELGLPSDDEESKDQGEKEVEEGDEYEGFEEVCHFAYPAIKRESHHPKKEGEDYLSLQEVLAETRGTLDRRNLLGKLR